MKITPANPLIYDFSRLLSSMQASGEADNLSLNPCLPGITGKVMHWPVISLLFEINHKPIAWFAALHTGKEWFSLPHFNNGAYWFHEKEFNTATGNGQKEGCNKRSFYNHFILSGEWFNTIPTVDRLLIISLDEEDMNRAENLPNTKATSIKVRDNTVLSEHRLSHKVDSQLELKNTGEQQLASLPSAVRRKINKATRNGISIQTGGAELLSTYYAVYRKKIHELGSFALPFGFFELLLKEYNHGDIRLMIAYDKDKPIGCAVLMTFGHYAENPWFATLKSHNQLYVSYLLHWEMIKYAINAGCSIYSFGYSTMHSGVHHYKQQWGATDKPIHLNSNHPVSDKLEKKQYLRSIIKRLPMSFTKWLDQYIAQRYY